MERARKRFSPEEAKPKLFAYCAYQERSHQEVRRKLDSLGVYGTPAEEIIAELITAGYLNEERFAKAFAGGKFRIKGWGRVRIQRELETHGITNNCIRSGMKEIDDEDYRKALEKLIRKKAASLSNDSPIVRRDKAGRYAIGKGYESDLVWRVVNEVLTDD
ncbi:regulatory protein RecX [Chryseolinea sp. T2]|uniref:regulatory protein RecX n=1 Tax=Chryseolinea sp. T2 TaxID=3129255 RepID=UPI003076D6BA